MERIERKYRTDLPPGPWNNEPDKVQWPDPRTGLACMVRRGPMGNWCGYVGVPDTHPWHGRHYEDAPVEVHGGLTYAALCDSDEETGICHVAGPGEPEPLWWFGFDCGHSWDLIPRFTAPDIADRFGDPLITQRGAYRDVAYVTAEVENLALQIANAAG